MSGPPGSSGEAGPAGAAPQRSESAAAPEDLGAVIERGVAGAVLGTTLHRGETTILIAPDRIVEVCRFLRDEPSLAFVLLVDLFGIHWMDREWSYEVIYLIHSFHLNRRVRLKVRLDEEGRVASVTGIHSGANWHEREAYDLVGIVFEGHPDLRRILMPDHYDAFPLRKDFPMKGF